MLKLVINSGTIKICFKDCTCIHVVAYNAVNDILVQLIDTQDMVLTLTVVQHL